jgi:hypothetical protein
MSYQPNSNDNENQSLRKINALGFNAEQDLSLSLGQFGAKYVDFSTSGAVANTGNFGCITALEDSVFSALTASNWIGDSPASLPLKAGVTIFGAFTGFTLTSGKVVAYNAAA